MHVRSRIIKGAAALALVSGAAVAFTAPTFASAAHRGHGGPPANALYVSNTSGSVSVETALVPGYKALNRGRQWFAGCAKAAYMTIGAAVSAASAGDTIVVCPGVYPEDVVVPATEPLTIEGIGNPIINATGYDNGFQVLASGSTIEGFTVAYAQGEGILVGALPGTPGTISKVTIRGNAVLDNDQGNPTGQVVTDSSYAECNGAPEEPGDCGEGIHLLSADDSTVVGNYVTANSGGILLTDENGPTDGNVIASNFVFANAYDCGITLAAHNVATVGGVYDNTIRDNEIANNGVVGQGAGVLMATGVPGGGVYSNIVERNSISGDGLAGVTVHAHAPGEDLNGNVIRDNVIGTNNLDGDFDFAGNTPSAADPLTTGVIVATTFSPISITVVLNRIEFDANGIFISGVTSPAPPLVTGTFSPNEYIGVTTDIFTS